MRRLSSLGSRQLRVRKGRALLTALGIVLGVAVLVGVLVANATTAAGVDRLVVDLVGRADVIVSRVGGFDATAPRWTFMELLEVDGVEVVAPTLTTRGALRIGEADHDIAVRGIEPGSMGKVQPITLLDGELFAPAAAQAVLPARLVAEHGLALGEQLTVAVPTGLRSFTLVGILEDRGLGRSDDGDVVFTSAPTLQAMLERPGEITNARIVLTDGVDVPTWIAEHEDALGEGYEFQDAAELASGFQTFLLTLGAIFTVFAGISLFIGAFLIYLTLTTAVVERTRIYGTLRALGASRRQIRRTVLLEATVLGLVSSLLGALAGLAIANGLLTLMERLFELDFGALEVAPATIGLGVGIGMLTTIVAASIPARRAARLEPTQAMLGGTLVTEKRGKAPIVGAVLASIGFVGAILGQSFATPLLLVGAVLVTPLVLPPLARIAGAITERIVRGLGPVAILHLVKERSRSGYTLGLVMTVMGTIFAIAGLSGSMVRSIETTLDAELGADLHVEPAGAVDPRFEDELRAVPEVVAVTPMRFAPVTILREPDDDDVDGFARIVDPATVFDVSGFVLRDGSLDEVRAGLERGGVVLLPAGLATQRGFEVGETVTLRTAEGPVGFTLVATYASLLPAPEIVLTAADGARYLGATEIHALHVNVDDGVELEAARTAIEDALGERYAFEVDTVSETKASVREDFDRFFSIFYAIVLIAGIVGLLGMANTLAVSVLQRTREIGVLRAVGASRRQVRVMVLVESLTMSLVAFLLSLPLGIGLGIVTLAGFESAFGLEAAYVLPVSWIPTVAIVGILLALVAAIAPARRAARLDVVEALAYE